MADDTGETSQGGQDESMDIRPKMEYLIVCDAVGYAPDGRKTLYGVMDHLNFFKFPGVLVHCAIVVRWTYGSGKHFMGVRIADVDKNVVFQTPKDCEFNLPDPLTSAEIVLALQQLKFPKPGTYWVQITLDGEKEEYEQRLKVASVRMNPEPPPAKPAGSGGGG